MSGCRDAYKNIRGLVLLFVHEEFSLARVKLLLYSAVDAVNKRIWLKLRCAVALKRQKVNVSL